MHTLLMSSWSAYKIPEELCSEAFLHAKASFCPLQCQGLTHINNVADWSGGWSNYGMLGVNQSFRRAHKARD